MTLAINDITDIRKKENELKKLTAELEKNNKDLETMLKGFVCQENRMIELKKRK